MEFSENKYFQIRGLLRLLGVPADYKGFIYTAYAAALYAEQTDGGVPSMTALYAETAERFGTNWKAVERAMRTVRRTIWNGRRVVLEKLAGGPLAAPPQAANLLDILAFPADIAQACSSAEQRPRSRRAATQRDRARTTVWAYPA